MKVLIIGGGGREHALAWKAAQSPRVSEVLVAPGNAGTAAEPRVRNIDIHADDIEALVGMAAKESVALTIVGPEVALVAGVVDRFQQAGLPCFGPESDAARLEGSKSFTKEFLIRHGIPTARYGRFSELEPALEYLAEHGAPIVVKANGLAAGKGVIVARNASEAEAAVRSMLGTHEFGEAGAEIIIEECLVGEEASFIAIVDGTEILPLASSQDHKARDDGDLGPNTGGMGAYSPAPVVTAQMHERIMNEVMLPTVHGLASEGMHYRGFLYAGLMISPDGDPKVLEFNCRLGDPEAQPILFRLRSDLVDHCQAALQGTLGSQAIEWDPRAAVGVVMASRGYPGDYRKGKTIRGLPAAPDQEFKVFHAGTIVEGEHVVTSGGRVLCAVGLGNDVREARSRVYEGIKGIEWDGGFFRNDIGYRAVVREETSA